MIIHAPSGLARIIEVFGDCNAPNFEAKNIVLFPLPYPLLYDGNIVNRARCHRLVVDNFRAVFQEIFDQGLSGQVKQYGGIYNHRPIRGKRNPSTHSWGIAIDLEPSKYPLGSTKRFPQPIVDIFKKFAFTYGGDFAGRKDGMHFQIASHY